MLDPIEEAQDLKKADADIRRATKAVLAQDRIVRELIIHNHDTSTAQALLETMQDTLSVLEVHRSQIARNLVDLNEGQRKSGAAGQPVVQPLPPPATDLGRAQELLDRYLDIKQENSAAQQGLTDTRALISAKLSPSAIEGLLALGRSEQQALLAYLDEVERVSRACSWENWVSGGCR